MQTVTPVTNQVSALEIRAQLERVCASEIFASVDRLRRFLEFIVDETLQGRGGNLKEFSIGVEVFDKSAHFDPRTDPIVRVQARRLRERLAQYYAKEGRHDPIVIELPKGSYKPVFHRIAGVSEARYPGLVPAKNTIAVLPFADHSPTGDQAYFCRGIADEIITALTRVPDLRVVACSSSLEDHERSEKVRQMAERYDVATIVDGSVRKSGEDLRITVRLLETATGSYIWSETFDRKAEHIFALQEEISRRIERKLRKHTEGEGTNRLVRHSTNLAAYNFYLKGRHHLSQRSEKALLRACEYFRQATKEDPGYALAFAGLADSYALLANYGVVAPMEVWTKAVSAASQAVLLNEHLSEARVSLGHVKATYAWDWSGAEEEFKKAISLNPDCATAHHWYARTCLAPLGRLDEAVAQMDEAQTLDPVSPIISRDAAVIFFFRRDFDAAVEQCHYAIQEEPNFYGAYWILGLVEAQKRSFDAAIEAFQRALVLAPKTPRVLGSLGWTLALSGETQHAWAILNELEELEKTRYISPFEKAFIYFGLGQLEDGFIWLDRALEHRSFELISCLVDPRFDEIRRMSAFASYPARMGLPIR
jgi:TolB-like protein/Tfp pilus assembly protein PilF